MIIITSTLVIFTSVYKFDQFHCALKHTLRHNHDHELCLFGETFVNLASDKWCLSYGTTCTTLVNVCWIHTLPYIYQPRNASATTLLRLDYKLGRYTWLDWSSQFTYELFIALTKCIVHRHELFLNLILAPGLSLTNPLLLLLLSLFVPYLLTTPRCRTCSKSFHRPFNRTQTAH